MASTPMLPTHIFLTFLTRICCRRRASKFNFSLKAYNGLRFLFMHVKIWQSSVICSQRKQLSCFNIYATQYFYKSFTLLVFLLDNKLYLVSLNFIYRVTYNNYLLCGGRISKQNWTILHILRACRLPYVDIVDL